MREAFLLWCCPLDPDGSFRSPCQRLQILRTSRGQAAYHGSSPHRRCRPCELTPLTLRKLFATTATCQKIERHQEDGLEVMGAFVKEGLRGRALSESPVFGHNRRHHARADSGPHLCPLWSLPLSRRAPQKEHVTLCILCLQRSTECPAVT